MVVDRRRERGEAGRVETIGPGEAETGHAVAGDEPIGGTSALADADRIGQPAEGTTAVEASGEHARPDDGAAPDSPVETAPDAGDDR